MRARRFALIWNLTLRQQLDVYKSKAKNRSGEMAIGCCGPCSRSSGEIESPSPSVIHRIYPHSRRTRSKSTLARASLPPSSV